MHKIQLEGQQYYAKMLLFGYALSRVIVAQWSDNLLTTGHDWSLCQTAGVRGRQTGFFLSSAWFI